MTRPPLPDEPIDRPSPWAPPRRPVDPHDPMATIGGYRLVRRLGADGEAATWLARGDDETVVLRVFRESASDARIDAELGARERLTGPHVAELLDVATSRAGRPVAVVRAVVGPLLSDVLATAPAPLRAGHVTTIIAPLAALLDAAHEVGATVGRLDAAAIRIDPAGAPVLVSLGAAAVAAPLPARFRTQEPSICRDRDALRALGTLLVAHVHEREREAVGAALASSMDPAEVEIALFDCAAPLPLDALTGTPSPSAGRDLSPVTGPVAPQETHPSPERPSDGAVSGERGAVGRVEAISTAIGLPAGLASPVDAVAAAMTRFVGERISIARTILRRGRAISARPRRGVVVVGAAGAIALVAAGLLASAETRSASSARADQVAEHPEVHVSAPEATVADDPGASASGSDQAASDGTASLPESLVAPEPAEWKPLVAELVERWVRCADTAMDACVAEVAHAGSGAEETLSIRSTGDGGATLTAALAAWTEGDRELVVVDRMGAAALVDLLEGETTTASLLVVRSEAGWRVRAVMP